MSICRKCSKKWRLISVVPRVLLCGHTFCEECLKESIQRIGEFICPSCDVHYLYQDLCNSPINRTLLEYIEESIPRIGEFIWPSCDVHYLYQDLCTSPINRTVLECIEEIDLKDLSNSSEDETRTNKMEEQFDRNNYAKVEDICMMDNCPNKRVSASGKKQIFCKECLKRTTERLSNLKEQSKNLFGGATKSSSQNLIVMEQKSNIFRQAMDNKQHQSSAMDDLANNQFKTTKTSMDMEGEYNQLTINPNVNGAAFDSTSNNSNQFIQTMRNQPYNKIHHPQQDPFHDTQFKVPQNRNNGSILTHIHKNNCLSDPFGKSTQRDQSAFII